MKPLKDLEELFCEFPIMDSRAKHRRDAILGRSGFMASEVVHCLRDAPLRRNVYVMFRCCKALLVAAFSLQEARQSLNLLIRQERSQEVLAGQIPRPSKGPKWATAVDSDLANCLARLRSPHYDP